MEAQGKFKSWLSAFLDRPLVDFVKISLILFLTALALLSKQNSVLIKIGVGAVGFVLIGWIVSKQFKYIFMSILSLFILLVSTSFSSSILLQRTNIEASAVLIPGVLCIYFATLWMFEAIQSRKLKHTFILFNGFAFLLFVHITAPILHEVNAFLSLLFNLILLLAEYTYLNRKK